MTEPKLENELALVFEGKKQLKDVLDLGAGRLELLTELAHLYFKEGRYEEARVLFEGLMALDMGNAYHCRALGAVNQRLGQLDAAVRYYQRSLKLDDQEPETWANLGEVLLIQGNADQGLAHLEHADKLYRTRQPRAPQRQRVQAILRTYRRVTQ